MWRPASISSADSVHMKVFAMKSVTGIVSTCRRPLRCYLPHLFAWPFSMAIDEAQRVWAPQVDSVAAGTSGEHLQNIGCESASSLSVSRAKNSQCRNASALQQIDSYCIHRMRKCVYIRRRCRELVNATAAHFRQKEQDALTRSCEFARDDALAWSIAQY